MNAPLGAKQFSLLASNNQQVRLDLSQLQQSVEQLMLEADLCSPAWAFEAVQSLLLVFFKGIGCGLCWAVHLINESSWG